MKRLNYYKKEADFAPFRRSMPYPSSSFILETGKVFIQKADGRTYNVGDVVLYDREEDEQIIVYYTQYNATDYPTSRYVPQGIVVIPQGFASEQARMMSLVNMSKETPESGTTQYEYIIWGKYNEVVAGLTDFGVSNRYQKLVDPSGSFTNSNNSWGYLPSDKFRSPRNAADVITAWINQQSNLLPSPYTSVWERNIQYGQGAQDASMLSDVDGKSNSGVLLAAETYQPNWAMDATIDGSQQAKHYPAALCCARYFAEGTNAGDWYLPAIGELGYVMVRWKIIRAALRAVQAVDASLAVPLHESHFYWSSTEFSQYLAYCLDTSGGYVGDYDRHNYFLVRAFCRLPRI